jgi:hypothetical protein
MYSINLIEELDTDTVEQYLSLFYTNIPDDKRARSLLVLLRLASESRIVRLEATFLDSPYFLHSYTRPDEEIKNLLVGLFGSNFDFKTITHLQAVCLVCLQVQAEPFATYLSQNLSKEVIADICSGIKAKTRTPITDQSVVIKSLLASASGETGLKQLVTESPGYSLIDARKIKKITNVTDVRRQFVPRTFEDSIWEQIQNTVLFVAKLNKHYPFSPYVLDVKLNENYSCDLNFGVSEEINECYTVFRYIKQNRQSLPRIQKKLTDLFYLLGELNLHLGKHSLNELLIDKYENIWIADLRNSRELAPGEVLAKAIPTGDWNKELSSTNLKFNAYGSSGSSMDDGTASTASEEEDDDIIEELPIVGFVENQLFRANIPLTSSSSASDEF